ncbi:MAG: hypothetical protein V3S02_04005 [Dehalococcoidales bacterium]
MAIEVRYPVMSPEPETTTLKTEETAPVSASLAKRLDTLENKTVYLIDTGYGGSWKFMQQVQNWFAENIPSVTTIRKRKTGHVFMDDTTDLWDEIKEKGDAVVLGVAG